MIYDHYLKQPKSMLEWKLNGKLAKNPELVRAIDRNISHPLICKYSHID